MSKSVTSRAKRSIPSYASKGTKHIYVHCAGDFLRVTFVGPDNTYRDATDDELEAFVRARPHQAEECRPDFIRSRLADIDGELLAYSPNIGLPVGRRAGPSSGASWRRSARRPCQPISRARCC